MNFLRMAILTFLLVFVGTGMGLAKKKKKKPHAVPSGQYAGGKTCQDRGFYKKPNGEDGLLPGCDIQLLKGYDGGLVNSGAMLLQVAVDADGHALQPEVFSGQQPNFAAPSTFRSSQTGKSNAVRGSQSAPATQ